MSLQAAKGLDIDYWCFLKTISTPKTPSRLKLFPCPFRIILHGDTPRFPPLVSAAVVAHSAGQGSAAASQAAGGRASNAGLGVGGESARHDGLVGAVATASMTGHVGELNAVGALAGLATVGALIGAAGGGGSGATGTTVAREGCISGFVVVSDAVAEEGDPAAAAEGEEQAQQASEEEATEDSLLGGAGVDELVKGVGLAIALVVLGGGASGGGRVVAVYLGVGGSGDAGGHGGSGGTAVVENNEEGGGYDDQHTRNSGDAAEDPTLRISHCDHNLTSLLRVFDRLNGVSYEDGDGSYVKEIETYGIRVFRGRHEDIYAFSTVAWFTDILLSRRKCPH